MTVSVLALTQTLTNTELVLWLTDHQGVAMTLPSFVDELCARLQREGVQLLRVAGGMPTLHPQHYVRAFVWTRGGGTVEAQRGYENQNSAMSHDSPVALIHQGVAAIRRRLDVPNPQMDFPVLHEVKATGATDYLILPLRLTVGQASFIAWSTDRPGGFSNSELAMLHDLMPLIALRIEIIATRQMNDDVLTTYLGGNAAQRVLSGTVRRGAGENIRAAIWSSDLRGFTAMADRMSVHDLITTLDDYFECMAVPVQEAGGEVLKFIGDGVLAIFPVTGSDDAEACRRALDAALLAFDRLHELNQGRAIGGVPNLRIGIGLHLGDVIYGNIGAPDRLDFTVIGAAVNEVVRTESMSKVLERPLIATAEFAAAEPRKLLESLGVHVLRGKREPTELFAMPLRKVPGYE